jgi:hypothetical protein
MLNDPQLSLFLLAFSLLLVGGVLGMLLERMLARQRRNYWKDRNRQRFGDRGKARTPSQTPWSPPSAKTDPKPPDAAEQLRIVMGAQFLPQALLNRGEARVFRELDKSVLALNPGWQVMAQVSLGEILSSESMEAYSCINSKRVDLLLMDEDCQPRHALEYQGGGHYLGSAAARDAVKKEALRRAGIGYHEVVSGHTTPADLKRLVEKLVDLPAAMPSGITPAPDGES